MSSMLEYYWFGDRKAIQPVKMCEIIPKDSHFATWPNLD